MESRTATNLPEIERKLLAALERHGSDGRSMTIESLAVTAGVARHSKELALALKRLVERGLVRQAGEDPIPGSAIAFRLVTPLSRDRIDKAKDQPAATRAPSSPAEPTTRRKISATTPRHRPGGVVADERMTPPCSGTESQVPAFSTLSIGS
jgi:hypothetical protein